MGLVKLVGTAAVGAAVAYAVYRLLKLAPAQAMTIQHTVLFKLPTLPSEVEAQLQAVVVRFNELPGIKDRTTCAEGTTSRQRPPPPRCCAQASFRATGLPRGDGSSLSLQETTEALAWPDKTDGYTHCLLVLAADVPSLKAYLHSDLHLKEWIGHMKPAGATGPPIVFDSPLALAL